jgi:peptide deformylase
MIETMREAPGVGLAAPQVNIGQQLIVVEYSEDEDEEEAEKWNLISKIDIDKEVNPRILAEVLNNCLTNEIYFVLSKKGIELIY